MESRGKEGQVGVQAQVECEIQLAKQGNLQPLLDRVGKGVVMASKSDGPDPGDDGDGTWSTIQAATMAGDLTEEQCDRLYDAAKPL